MKLLGTFLLSFGAVTILYTLGEYLSKLSRWRELQSVSSGKRYAATNYHADWMSRLGQRCSVLLSSNQLDRIRRMLIWSGFDNQGRVNQFLGLCLLLFVSGLIFLFMAAMAVIKFQLLSLGAIGLLFSLMLISAPVIGIVGTRVKREDKILKEIPLLCMSIRRELVREANYIEAFERAEKELTGVLKDEVNQLNAYVRSTKGDLRTALEQFRERCGHKAVELFCMTILQGMDTDRVIDGLKELDIQMSSILKDRVHKQTEKRNLIVFVGTMMAASILILQGGFYGLIKLKQQMSSLPF